MKKEIINHISLKRLIINDLKTDWKFITLTIISSILLHILLWFAWPLHSGADAETYLYYFIDSFHKNPVFHNLMCFRTPVAPFFFGSLLTVGGSFLTTIILEILSLSALISIYLICTRWGKLAARAAAIIFSLMIAYQIQYHQVGSDVVFSWLIIIFIFFLKYSFQYENIRNWIWAVLGVVISFATLTRPGGIVLSLVVISILFLNFSWKKKIAAVLITVTSIVIILGGYVLYKGIRYDDFSIARGFNHTISYRIFRLQDNAINEENGPASRKLIGIIKSDILTTDVYKNYGVTIEEFLSYKPNSRLHGDLISTVDIKEGWKSNYRLLLDVSIESIKAHPKVFVSQYLKDIMKLLVADSQIQDVPNNPGTVTEVELNDKGVPVPTEDEIIPYSNHWWLSTRPDGSFPGEQEIEDFKAESKKLTNYFTGASGNEKIGIKLKQSWNLFHFPLIYFWILGIIGIILAQRNERIFLLSIFILFVIYTSFTLLGAPPWLKYRLPLDPVFLILGIAGITNTINRLKGNLIEEKN